MSPEIELTREIKNLYYRIDAINADDTGLCVSLVIVGGFGILSLCTATISVPLSLALMVTGGMLGIIYMVHRLRQESKEKHLVQRQINKLTGKPEDYIPMFFF